MNADPSTGIFQQGLALHQQGRLDEAERLYQSVLAQNPSHFGALHFTGMIQIQRGQHEQGVHWIGRALEIRPDDVAALSNLGHALHVLRRLDESLECCDHALRIQPDNPEALNNRGNVLLDFGQFEAALACYDRALQVKPTFPQAHDNRGNVLRALGRLEEALECHRRALQIWPDYPMALDNCGRVLRELKRYDEAAPLFARLLAVAPKHPYAPGLLFDTRLNCCEWTGYDAAVAALSAGIERGERLDVPHAFSSYALSPQAQLKCAQTYAASECPTVASPFRGPAKSQGERIHIAYLSADFRNHPVPQLMAGLFENHDRSRFKTTGVSFGPNDGSPMRRRLEGAFEHFIDVRDKRDHEIVAMLRDAGVDIAIDLMGFTAHHRVRLLAQRVAPLQVNYLGFTATMGVPFIDYIIADRHVIPARHESAYVEKVVRLPDTYLATDDKLRIAEETPSRASLGLPESGFVFCSFNNSFKIRPYVFDVWMRLLRDIDGSVLWLLDDNAMAKATLRRQAEQRGVAPERLVFAPRAPIDFHLARHRQADLFLDTFPYNAHTTAADALWAGLPLVTVAGETLVSRVATSLLTAIGLPELATDTLADYESLARTLARTPARLADVRARLAKVRLDAPLFDTPRFTRHIESAYTTMFERYRRGEAPAAFDVAAGS
jgi:predicted O-linked N-acetylglucosamine transferase (SPINDLY family)